MKLKTVYVTNFRSAEDTEPFEVEDITCLVGKNEAGKTAVLQALAGLNPHPATPFAYDKERDYPRRYLNEYDKRHSDENAVVISTTWEFEQSEVAVIDEEFGPDALSSSEVTIIRSYDQKQPTWQVSINYKSAVDHLIASAQFSAPERSQVQKSSNSKTLREAIESITEPSEKQKQLLAKLNAYPGQSIRGKIEALLSQQLPRFMYFSNYDRMSGAVRLDLLAQNQANNTIKSSEQLFLDFLDFAGAPVDKILASKTYEAFNAKLQSASTLITDKILAYWSQNPYIEVRINVDAARPGDKPPYNEGVVGRARIYNLLHRVDVPFSERSAGFIWFFSFLVKFARVKDDGGPIILLLDEPGLTLHGKAQADLIRYFEKELLPFHQILYSTHSPFMVPPHKLTSARIVEDLIDTSKTRPQPIGTKVRNDVLNRDPDTIFPLQGALGYTITQSLFVGKYTLLVEGPSDILYLKALSSASVRRDKPGLDSRWTICPAGGIGNIRPFVSLFKGNELNIVTFTDYAKGDKNKIENLRASQILKTGAVLTADQFTDKREADTEDLFEPSLFINLVNKTYSLTKDHVLTAAKLKAAAPDTDRLVKQTDAYFKTLPDTIPMFDHFAPSEWLIQNPAFLDQDNASTHKTLERAEALFSAINQFLDQTGT